MIYYSIKQLKDLVNRTPRTIREHISKGWLKAEKVAGAKGWRISRRDAEKWAARYFGQQLAQ